MKTAITTLFVLCAVFFSKAQNIRQAEYFIDKDKGVGKNTKISLPASADSNYTFNIDLSGLSMGIHKLYIRAKDSDEKWSLTARKNIEVIASFDQQNIIAGEYFFDNDPGYGKANEITISAAGADISQTFFAAALDLKNGYHKLYSRFRDSSDNWSITSRSNIELIRTADTIKIIAAEYFFASDKGYGRATTKTFGDSSADGKFKLKIPFDKIPAGVDTLFIRVQDSLGNWSLTKLDTFTVGTLAAAMLNDDSRISNSVKQLTVFPNPATQFININYQLQNKVAVIQIFDVDGKVAVQPKTMNTNNFQLDISKLIAGTYILQLKTGDTIQTVKFIKQ